MTDPLMLHHEVQHSPLGPSSFARAEACPASTDEDALRLARRDTSYADEGTTAHVLLAACLQSDTEAFEWMDQDVIAADGEVMGTVDAEMVKHISVVVDYVRANLLPTFSLEQKLHLKDTPMFGHADVLGQRKSDLLRVVLDLKYGMRWVPADAVQMGLYALMDAERRGVHLDGLDPHAPIALAVVAQPRMPDPIRTHIWRAHALIDLRRRVHALIALRASGNALPFAAGDHCTYCGRAAFCPQLRALAKDAALARIALNPEDVVDGKISADDIDDALAILPAVEKWVGAVRGAMEHYLMNGGSLRNAKVVRGRGSRGWTDEEAAQRYIESVGVDPFEQTLLSPAKAEKAVPKMHKKGLEPLIESYPGKLKPALIHEPGEALQVAAGLENAALASMAMKRLAQE